MTGVVLNVVLVVVVLVVVVSLHTPHVRAHRFAVSGFLQSPPAATVAHTTGGCSSAHSVEVVRVLVVVVADVEVVRVVVTVHTPHDFGHSSR